MISTHSRSSRFVTARFRTTRVRGARSRGANRGFSLIEVAIALVIFVIGALAIIRIFPGALSVIGNNGNQQIATNLNRSEIASLLSEQTNAITKQSFNAVPYSTFNIAVNADGTLKWKADDANHTGDFGDIDSSVIGVPRFNKRLPSSEDINTGANNSALSRFRGIQGEQATVFTLNGSTDKYILTQFPISLAKINGGATNTLLEPTINQEYTVENARIDKLGKVTFANATITDVSGATVRLDDATNAQAMAENTVSAGSMIYVSYRYSNAAGTWGVSNEALPITTAIDASNIPARLSDATLTVTPPTTTRGASVNYDTANPTKTGEVAEIVDVRVKRLSGVGAFGSSTSDPAPGTTNYPNVNQVGDARLGLVRIPSSVTTATVTVDYIADWSFLLQDGPPLLTANATYPALPASPPPPPDVSYRQIALGTPFIEDQAPASVYSLLIDSNVPYRSYYGTDQVEPAPINRLVRADNPRQREDELRSGKVTFIVENSAARARVAYQTRDSWVKQLSVAAAAYKPYVANGAEPWRDYYLGNDNYLYFHASEAGKTISVSYRTTDDTGPLIDRPFVLSSEIIDTPTGSPANVPASFASSGRVSRVKLTDAQGRTLPDNPTLPTSATDPQQLLSIQAVKGISVTSRTAYINGTQYKQALLTTTRGANS